MKNQTLISSVTILFVAMVALTGCSNNNDTSITPNTFSVTASDGYIVKLNSPAVTACQDGKTYETRVVGEKGLLTFSGLTDYDGCFVSVPRDAIVDSDGDNVYTLADENNFIGYEMTAVSSEHVIVSQFSTMIVDLIKQGKTAEAEALNNLTKNVDLVEEIKNATSSDNAIRSKAIQLIALGEIIKTAKKIGIPSAQMVKINTAVTLSAIKGEILEVDTRAIASSLPDATKAAVIAQADVITSIATSLQNISENVSDKDIKKLMISISDGGLHVTDAFAAITANFKGGDTGFDVKRADADLRAARTQIDAAVTATPAHLTLGPVLVLGDLSVALSLQGTFELTLDVDENINLVDFSKVTLPKATITKGFPTQNIGLMSTVTDADNTDNIIEFEFANETNDILLDAGENNVSVKITVPAGSFAYIDDSVSGETYSTDTEITQVNTDLEFDACTAIGGCENNLIDGLNDYLRVPGKKYYITIKISGFNNNISPDGKLTVDYTTITGTVRTTAKTTIK